MQFIKDFDQGDSPLPFCFLTHTKIKPLSIQHLVLQYV